MPIKFLSKDIDWGCDVYLRKDESQTPFTLVGIKLGPGHVCFQLSNGFEIFECYDFEISTELDEALKLSFTGGHEE